MYWHAEVSTPTQDRTATSTSITAWHRSRDGSLSARSLIEGTDGCGMTLAYELSACTPEAKRAIGGWGKHRLIIVNNLQAGSRIKDRRQDERRHFWQNALNHPPAGCVWRQLHPRQSFTYTDGLFKTLPHSLFHHFFYPVQEAAQIEGDWKLTEYSQKATGERRFFVPRQVDCSCSIFICSGPTLCKWYFAKVFYLHRSLDSSEKSILCSFSWYN